ncbi:pimeloyl-ACP methyl ester carboxylesterase [Nocardia tenerifensis]|uniref:Pimeloyl-ACP methyl ester carboxylesterase n=1 Tax=Nocardia tenerifensis TaxID=228006 RepID=A0A318KYB8_9NOCA|nr:alpha/beta hydrolase [Nocardia tenerifensis]PXX70834.1 pimeloyl-ACP methyl ester carboxylesterase [Nocardia tenerifensis]
MTQTSSVSTHTLDVPGARLHYELRGSGPLIALVGAPMDAAAFAPVADLLATDHTVLTMDPRGHKGSVLDDPEQDSTPELRADDLAAILTHLDAGPAVVFGSSGGAVTVLALVQAYPELLTTAIPHEPPLNVVLDNHDELRASTADLVATYASGDTLGAWRKFFANANIQMPEPVLEQMFGGDRDPAQVASERFWYLHEIEGTGWWEPDLAALRATPVRVIPAIGADSAGQFCDRTTRALAEQLGLEPALFPGGHAGFVEDPATFAERLRAVLG